MVYTAERSTKEAPVIMLELIFILNVLSKIQQLVGAGFSRSLTCLFHNSVSFQKGSLSI